jgi:hypothetical protein
MTLVDEHTDNAGKAGWVIQQRLHPE